MITSSIKTNLILKEIGVTRYSLRSCKEKTNDKEVHTYQKGNILTLLDIGFNDLPEDQADLLKAIIGAIKPNQLNEKIESTHVKSAKELEKIISSNNDLTGVIIFNDNEYEIEAPIPIIRSSTLQEIIKNPSLKKPLWEKIKNNLIK
jgi:DNA polymerase III psi subunit